MTVVVTPSSAIRFGRFRTDKKRLQRNAERLARLQRQLQAAKQSYDDTWLVHGRTPGGQLEMRKRTTAGVLGAIDRLNKVQKRVEQAKAALKRSIGWGISFTIIGGPIRRWWAVHNERKALPPAEKPRRMRRGIFAID